MGEIFDKSNQQKLVLTLFFTMIVVMLGFGMIIPIMPFYIKSFGASGSALGTLMAIYGAMQLIFAPLWGSLSDRYGRKPILMIGVLGNAIAQLIFGLSTELWMLFAARALSGILSSATLPTAMAYIGDITSPEQRGGKMGMIGAAMGIGMVIGPGAGGWLAERSLSLPFFLASALSFLALILIFLILSEPPRKEAFVARATRPLQPNVLIQALAGPMGVLFLLAFLFSFGLTNFEGIFGLYAADRYAYTPQQVGGILTVIGLIAAVVQGGLTGPLTRRFGEITVIRISMIGSAAGFIFLILASNQIQLLLAVSFFVISHAMINPAVSALISMRTKDGQGVAMGVNNSFQSLGRTTGPLWAGLVYDVEMNLPYFTGAIILFLGFGVSMLRLKDTPVNPEAIDIIQA